MKRSLALLQDFYFNLNDYPKSTLFILVLVFFIFLLPALPQESIYHSDERFYTDAAVSMIRHQDFLTPHYPDGSLRLNKPIVTYWALIASYAAWDINYFGARFPFLLAGCLTLWLTFHLSMRLFRRSQAAFLSVAILACNLQFITLSIRATPDILQTLFLNVSLYGFIAIILSRDFRLRNYLYAYFGAALSVATKGLLGIVPVVFAFSFIFFAKEKQCRVKNLLHWPIMLAAIAVSISWFALMYIQHGQAELGRFYQDQVGERLSGPKYIFLLNARDYLWGVFRYFLPWCLVVILGYRPCRQAVHTFFKQHWRAVAFIVAWVILLLLIFSSGNISRTRYLIPAYPLLAVFFASLFMEVIHHRTLQRLWRWLCGGILLLLTVCGSLLTMGGLVLHWRLVVAGILLVSMGGPGLWVVIKHRKVFSPVVIGLFLLLTTACGYDFVLPVFKAVPSKQIADSIMHDQTITFPVSLWSERKFKFAGQLYLISKGQIIPYYFHKGPLPRDLNKRPLVLLSQKTVDAIPLKDYKMITSRPVSKSTSAGEIWQAMKTGGKKALLLSLQEPCYLVRLIAGQ